MQKMWMIKACAARDRFGVERLSPTCIDRVELDVGRADIDSAGGVFLDGSFDFFEVDVVHIVEKVAPLFR